MPQKHIPDDPNVKRGVLLLLVYITIHNYKGFVNHNTSVKNFLTHISEPRHSLNSGI